MCMVRQIFLHNYESFFPQCTDAASSVYSKLASGEAEDRDTDRTGKFLFCALFLLRDPGEINAFYIVIPGWDTILHTLNGFCVRLWDFSWSYY